MSRRTFPSSDCKRYVCQMACGSLIIANYSRRKRRVVQWVLDSKNREGLSDPQATPPTWQCEHESMSAHAHFAHFWTLPAAPAQ
jgi:hypothetical protein